MEFIYTHIYNFGETYRVPTKKGHPKCVQYFISVYRQLLQKIYIAILAQGLGVIYAKDGGYNFINKKVTAIFVRHDFYRTLYEFH